MSSFKMFHHFSLILSMLICFAVVDPSEATRKKRATTTTTQRCEMGVMSNSLNAFSFDLYKTLSDDEKGNLVFSPYSVYAILAMLSLGSDGKTKQQIETALKWKGDENYLDSLSAIKASFIKNGKSSSKLEMANNGWVDAKLNVLKSFTRDTEKFFGVAFSGEDFRDGESVRGKINKWVSANTGKQIPELFPVGSFDHTTKMVLANAIYFKGQWAMPFDEKRTRPDMFHVGEGVVKFNATMMSQTGRFLVGNHRNVQLLELPYGEKSKYTMLLARPRDPSEVMKYEANDKHFTDIARLEEEMDEKLMQEFFQHLKEMKVDVFVPKFKLKKSFKMEDKLQALGVKEAFNQKADFSRITGDDNSNLYISQVEHKAFVEIDERGTKAGAATGAGISFLSKPPQIRFDRPFLFFIIHKRCNTVLFTGRVTDPTL